MLLGIRRRTIPTTRNPLWGVRAPHVSPLSRPADIPAIVEFSKRPSNGSSGSSSSAQPTSAPGSSSGPSALSKFHAHHVVTPTEFTLKDCLAISDVVISAVPVDSYKVPTAQLKDGCVCVNVAGEKNFEADVRDRVSGDPQRHLARIRSHAGEPAREPTRLFLE
jgi:hypothetical protein